MVWQILTNEDLCKALGATPDKNDGALAALNAFIGAHGDGNPLTLINHPDDNKLTLHHHRNNAENFLWGMQISKMQKSKMQKSNNQTTRIHLTRSPERGSHRLARGTGDDTENFAIMHNLRFNRGAALDNALAELNQILGNGGIGSDEGVEINGNIFYPIITFTAQKVQSEAAQIFGALMTLKERTAINANANGNDTPAEDSTMTAKITEIRNTLKHYKNVILEGVPGTGKTYFANMLNSELDEADQYKVEAMTFHPSTAYEDFIEGIRPVGAKDNDKAEASPTRFAVRPGFFRKLCEDARAALADDETKDKKFLVILDEINRANVPSVLGDLLTLLEADKRGTNTEVEQDTTKVTLPYSTDRFSVPRNVYVIGTMNTSDKSVAPLDVALRRRFAFIRIEPMKAVELMGKKKLIDTDHSLAPSIAQWHALNRTVLAPCLGPDAMLGHSYFFAASKRLAENQNAEHTKIIKMLWRYELLPQLVDILAAHNAQDLLDADKRSEWLGGRGLAGYQDDPSDTITAFLEFIEGLGLQVTLEGTGYGKALHIGKSPQRNEENGAAANDVDAGHDGAREVANAAENNGQDEED